jgi:hypothetical protein
MPSPAYRREREAWTGQVALCNGSIASVAIPAHGDKRIDGEPALVIASACPPFDRLRRTASPWEWSLR